MDGLNGNDYRLQDEASITPNLGGIKVNRDEVHYLSNCDWICTHCEYYFETSLIVLSFLRDCGLLIKIGFFLS